MKTDKDDNAVASLTKREYFAAKALQGILRTIPIEDLKYSLESVIPLLAIKYADMLIEELNKTDK